MLVNVFFGGMRSITFVQAFQYWLKLTALLVPAMFLLSVWVGDGATSPADPSVVSGGVPGDLWSSPLTSASEHPLYTTYSIIIATFLGTMGLPHVVVRFYTNPDGRTARRTTLVVLAPARPLLPPAARVRRARPALRTRPHRHRGHRHGRAGAPGADGRRARRRAALRPDRGRRVRGVPVHVLRADHRGRRRDQPGRDGPSLPRGARVPGRRRRRGRRTPRSWRSRPRASASPARSAWPSRSRRPPSARCSCSASGGGG